jgi:hypothetical protein
LLGRRDEGVTPSLRPSECRPSSRGSTMGRTEEGKVTVIPHSQRKSRKNGCGGEKPRLRRRFSRNFARNIH